MRKLGVFLFVAVPLILLLVSTTPSALAAAFGTIRGIVHDPQHRPVAGATVVVKAKASDWSATTQTNDDGEFTFSAVAVGDYTVKVSMQGFDSLQQNVTVESDSS